MNFWPLRGIERVLGARTARRFASVFLAGVAILAAREILGAAFRDQITPRHDAAKWFPLYEFLAARLAQGEFPLWDPYTVGGVPFHPALHVLGLLDPLSLVSMAWVAKSGAAYTGYLVTYLARYMVFSFGAFGFFRALLRSAPAAAFGAGILALAALPSAFKQNGQINSTFLVPLALWLAIRAFGSVGKWPWTLGFFLVAGIAANIYVPSYFLFALVAFLPAWILLGKPHGARVPWKPVAIGCLLAGALAAPAAVTALDTATPSGELIPTLRLFQKVRALKQFMASETPISFASEGFTGRDGRHLSTGNLIGLLVSDVWLASEGTGSSAAITSMGKSSRGWVLSEVQIYVGVLALALACVGLLSGRSAVSRPLGCVALLAFGMGFNPRSLAAPPSSVQEFLYWMLPFMKGVETTQNLGLLLQVALCGLAGEGILVLAREAEDRHGLRSPWPALAAATGLALLGRFLIAESHLGSPWLGSALSRRPHLLVDVSLFFALAVSIGVATRRLATRRLACGALALLGLADVWSAGMRARGFYGMEMNGLVSKVNAAASAPGRDLPFRFKSSLSNVNWWSVDAGFVLAYTSLFSRFRGTWLLGNQQFFVTKRSYDLLVYLPLDQFAGVVGVTEPVLDFRPIGSERRLAGSEAVSWLAAARRQELSSSLTLESSDPPIRSAPPDSLRGFPDGEWMDVEGSESPKAIVVRNLMSVNAAEPVANVKGMQPLSQNSGISARVEEFRANTATFLVDLPREGFVTYADNWSRHWTASIDGLDTQVLVANHSSKAVLAPKGRHRIRFEYRPVPNIVALGTYFLALGVFGAIFVGLAGARLFAAIVAILGNRARRRPQRFLSAG